MDPLIDNLPWFLVTILTILSVDLLLSYFKNRGAYQELKEEYAKRDLLLNSVAEGVYGLDLNGNCTFCNAATLKLLGYRDEKELVGHNVHHLIHHTHADGRSYAAEDCKACLAYKQNQEVHLEDEVFWRADGTKFQAEYWSYPVLKGTKLVGAVVSFVDITERKLTEARINAANRELDAFAYTVSHDLRTPLSAVIGFSDLIKEKYRSNLADEAIDLLDAIEMQGLKMASLVEDLLALATVGSLPSPELPVDSNAELAYVLGELSQDLEDSGTIVVPGDLPAVRIPETLLVQIFQNLVVNALRYAGKEGGPIEVGGDRQGTKVRFFVRDHGVGIPEAERSRIFEVFYRGSTGRAQVGSGVGLATVQKIARHYGGNAWVEETPGGGATFWVEMDG